MVTSVQVYQSLSIMVIFSSISLLDEILCKFTLRKNRGQVKGHACHIVHKSA